jgi:hypothetical protein
LISQATGIRTDASGLSLQVTQAGLIPAMPLNHVRSGRLETWLRPLAIGQVLPTIPLWLDVDLAVPLSLEASYEETCAALRIR